MEGITRAPGSRAAEYKRTHPGTDISQVEGIWRAWSPGTGSTSAGELTWGRDEDDLLDKLAAAG